MHSFLAGAVFVAMVFAPCVIALLTGVETKQEAQEHSLGDRDVAV